MPFLCKFLMSNTPTDMCDTVIESLRQLRIGYHHHHHNDSIDNDNEGGGERRKQNKKKDEITNAETLTLESLSQGFQYRSDFTSALLRSIQSITSSTSTSQLNHYSPADIWLLFCCALAPHNKNKVLSIFRTKSTIGAFSSSLLSDAIVGNGPILDFLFQNSLCVLADGLVRSSSSTAIVMTAGSSASSGALDKSASYIGGILYELLYWEFGSNAMRRQEIVGALVTHVGSGCNNDGSNSGNGNGEVDEAMEVFTRLVERKKKNDYDEDGPSSLRPYAPFLISLLDHVQQLSAGQVRKLFLLLFAVGNNDDDDNNGAMRSSGGGGMGGCDDVHIVIRKHLSLATIAMKQIGIIGAVAFAVSRSSKCAGENALDNTEETSGEAHNSSVEAEITNVLEMACSNCSPRGAIARRVGEEFNRHGGRLATSFAGSSSSYGSALALLFDELCLAVRGGRLAPSIKSWILDRFSANLEELYLGDLADPHATPQKSSTQSGSMGSSASALGPSCNIEDASDRALVEGTSANSISPRGDLRFNIDGEDALVYLKFLPMLSSNEIVDRQALPLQLCPLFRLLATCNDTQYGGQGLSEVDALLGCPLLLPSESSVGDDFQHLPPAKQWTATASIFFATCWCRELINAFIFSAAFPVIGVEGKVNPSADESQICNQEDIRNKVVGRIRTLVELEEELRFTASKCFDFSPPGLAPLPTPKELIDSQSNADTLIGEHDSETQGRDSMGVLSVINDGSPQTKMSKEERKAMDAIKKAAKREAAERMKSKTKRMKIRQKHETALSERSISALRPLSSLACLALGFPELSIVGQAGSAVSSSQQGMMSLGSSQLQNLHVGGPLTTLLLTQLNNSLSGMFSDKKPVAFHFRSNKPGATSDDREMERKENDMDLVNNPYESNESKEGKGGNGSSLFDSLDSNVPNDSLNMLETYLAGNVFASVHEHLAAAAEICGGNINKANYDQDREEETKQCICLLLGCVTALVRAKELTSSTRGRKCLASVLKQLSVGERDRQDTTKTNGIRVSFQYLIKPLSDLFDLAEEIVVGGESDDILFVMQGVGCLESILNCVLCLDGTMMQSQDEEQRKQKILSIRKKVSNLCHRLLQRNWSKDTKYKKSDVGKLLSLYIEHSYMAIPSDARVAASSDISDLGHIGALATIIRDVLAELPNTNHCRGPVDEYPTCCLQSFGCYLSVVLSILPKELNLLFDSSLGKTEASYAVEKALLSLAQLVELLSVTFDLTKENPILVKRPYLLQQLKWGTRFMEVIVARVVPFLQKHFQEHEQGIIDIIRHLQGCTRQISSIITHGKREKDTNLAKETPRAKKVLESFIHKIKALMRKNRCLTALGGGNLKSKHIDGSIIEDDDADSESSDSSGSSSEKEGDAMESENEFGSDDE